MISSPWEASATRPSANFCKAGKAASATFYVNGKKRATVSSPRPGTAVILRGVGATSETTVRAVVKPRTGKAVSVSRSYLACS